MARGKTLWQMLMEKIRGVEEFRYYNPLRARVGNAVMLDEVELRDFNFFIKEMIEYKRRIGSDYHYFVDYVLLARPLHGEDVWRRLRLVPVDDPDRVDGLSHTALLLNLYDEMAYSEDLHKVVNDKTGKFEVIEEGKIIEEYWRINDVMTPYLADLAVLKDINKNSRVERDEVTRKKVEFWDYWRETIDEVKLKLLQFLFVELDQHSGWFQIWQGREIDPKKVMVM